MIESAGPVLSGFKDNVVNKATGFLGRVTGKSGGGSSPNIPKMLSSLAIVLGGYFGFVWVARKLSPRSNSRLPSDVVEILGRAPFGPKQTLQLVRLGSKLVLLLTGPDGTHPIGEITDPVEVEHLASLCGSSLRSAMGSARSSSSARRADTSPATHRPPSSQSGQSGQSENSPALNSEQVTRSLTNVLRNLENSTRPPARNSFEA